MAATADAPAGERQMDVPQAFASAQKASAFVTAQQQGDIATDIGAAPDQALAHGRGLGGPLLSGPMLTAHHSVSELDSIPDVPFAALCNSGAAWTRTNWPVKLWRYGTVGLKNLYLPFMTAGLPTNFLMLTFRTFNRDFGLPHHNEDHLAAKLRDSLMPARGKMHRAKSLFLKWKTALLDCPLLGLPGIVNFIDVRTQWFDAAVKRAIADGIKQVVIIAAGYDTRAYRLASPGVKFFEVDLPHASDKKQQLVRQHMPAGEYSWPEFVGADLSKVSLMEALSATSWDSSKRTMFIIEGLTYYLPPDAFKQQLTAVAESAVAGSRLFFDFMRLDAMAGNEFNPGFETLWLATWNKGETMLSAIDERPQAIKCMLKKFGFRLYETLNAEQITARFHPHAKWNRRMPHVAPCFSYIAAEKVLAPFKRVDTVHRQGEADQAVAAAAAAAAAPQQQQP